MKIKHEPCPDCGNDNPVKECIGCMHMFKPIKSYTVKNIIVNILLWVFTPIAFIIYLLGWLYIYCTEIITRKTKT